jgi:U3 small nucleolar RNA-associated protein 10
MVVRAVGVEDCLGVVLAMLVERYSKSALSVSDFVLNLTSCFEAATVLSAANQWLGLVFDALQPRSAAKQKKMLLSDSLLAFSAKPKEEQVEAREALIDGLSSLLRHQALRKRLAVSLNTGDDDSITSIRLANVSLTEQTIQLAQRPGMSSDTNLQEAADGLLTAVLGLLPTKDFIASCAQLMQSGSSSTREQVFHSLESRVHSSKPSNAMERQTFLDVLPSCAVFISHDQPVEVRMAAIGCIDAISEKFGKSDRRSVKNAAVRVAADAALGADDNKLRVLSLLCLASMAGVLGDGDESTSIFPDVLSLTLDYLESNITGDGPRVESAQQSAGHTQLPEAGFRLLSALLDHVTWILASGPRDLDRAIGLAAREKDCDAAAEFRALSTKKIRAAELFESVDRTWSGEVKRFESPISDWTTLDVRLFMNLVDMLHQAVQYHTKATITKNASNLFNLLLKGFDLRRQVRGTTAHIPASDGIVDFTKVDDLALETTLKMNDATFRPFFNRLVEWATTGLPGKDTEGRTERLKSLYSFALLLFERLRSLVTSYMSFLLDNAGEVLRDAQSQYIDPNLLGLVVNTLGSSFRDDEDDFWTAPSHFDVVAQPPRDHPL